MISAMHFWLANPRSLGELDALRDELDHSIPLPRGDLRVFCETRERAVRELAAGLMSSLAGQAQIEQRAQQLGVSTATAMFAIESEPSNLGILTPPGLTYLGSLDAGGLSAGASSALKPLPPGSPFRPDQIVAFASTQCVGPERKPVCYMRRDARLLTVQNHTGWLLFSGQETADMLANPSDIKRVSLPAFVREDPSLAPLIDAPPGSEWTRSPREMIWRRIIDGQVIDSAGRVIGPAETIRVGSNDRRK